MTEAEFLAAFHRQKDRVYRLALSYTKSVPDAEDVCQTVFLETPMIRFTRAPTVRLGF